MSRVLLIEAFYAGSHSQLIDTLGKGLEGCAVKYTLPGKKWHWRARTSALYFSEVISPSQEYRILFTSSVLNLAELVALRPDLSRLTKIVYFHENQLVYPVRKQKDRDFQYGYNQIITCLTADIVLFNSKYNMESFLSSIGTFLKLMPDFRPKGLAEKIRPKSKVLYFPIEFPIMNDPIADVMEGLTLAEQASSLHESQEVFEKSKDRAIKSGVTGEQTVSCSSVLSQLSSPLKIVWAHRWEYDKNPDLFFRTLYKLLDSGEDFRISVLGEHYSEIPDIFTEAYESLKDNIVHWGYQQSKEDYYQVLIEGDVAVSTAKHEFYGVAMLEAVHCGCLPLCPNQLVYPEIFPKDCLYNTEQQLFKHLRRFCRTPNIVRNYDRSTLNEITTKCSWTSLKQQYLTLLSSQES
ncbi:tRNA-queuosine alpha-mannosyltransferase-like isoform X1 [Antedon mediterranea]|uniref:tRNA-queuosine alpha-mannosyltransferase-like isoform X1 n=1 Tax=Antedon mediterranea TaxID=105859 RepID=UPI003AF80AD7